VLPAWRYGEVVGGAVGGAETVVETGRVVGVVVAGAAGTVVVGTAVVDRGTAVAASGRGDPAVVGVWIAAGGAAEEGPDDDD
jgi:hypothetical protein